MAPDRSRRDWTLTLVVPDWLDAGQVDAAVQQLAAKGVAPRLADLRFDRLSEGRCV